MSCTAVRAQDAHPTPIGGVEALVATILDIQLSEDEAYVFERVGMRLLFQVDANGNARIERACGTTCDFSYKGFLEAEIPLPKFSPRQVDGVASPSYYILSVSDEKSYSVIQESHQELIRFGRFPKMDDLEEYSERERTLFVSLGGAGSVLTGNKSGKLGPGVGAFVDFRSPRGESREWMIGISVFFNRIREDFDLEPRSSQLRNTENVLISLGHGFLFGRNRITPELGSLLTNVSRSTDDVRGVSEFRYGLGCGFSRAFPVFRPFLFFSDGSVKVQSYLNLHVRALYFFNDPRVFGRGALLEIGLGYALGSRRIEQLRFKDEFFR